MTHVKQWTAALTLVAALALPTEVYAQAATYADRSGAIQTAGAAQQLAPKFPARRGCIIQNSSAGDIWIDVLGRGASAAQPSLKIATGASWTCPSPAPDSALSVWGATAGQAFTAWEW